jgi:hypothetical protein
MSAMDETIEKVASGLLPDELLRTLTPPPPAPLLARTNNDGPKQIVAVHLVEDGSMGPHIKYVGILGKRPTIPDTETTAAIAKAVADKETNEATTSSTPKRPRKQSFPQKIHKSFTYPDSGIVLLSSDDEETRLN